MTLSVQILGAVSGLANTLVERNVHLVPRAGTALAQVCQYTTTGGIEGDVVATLHERSARTEEGVNLHSAAREAIVASYVGNVRSLLSYARNVVAPETASIRNAVTAQLQARGKQVSGGYVIVNIEPDALLSTNTIADRIARFTEVLAKPVNTGEIAQLSADEVKRLYATTSEVDSILEQRVALSGIDSAGYPENVLFALNIDKVIGVFAGTVNIEDLNTAAMVAVHLIANALHDNPDAIEHPAAISLVEFNGRLADLTSQTGRILTVRYEAAVRRNRNDSIWAGIATDQIDGDRRIYVYGPSYRRALEAGLTPEATMGAAYGDRLTTDELIRDKAALERKYRAQQESYDEAFQTSVRELMLRYVGGAVAALVSTQDSAGTLIGDADSANARLRAVLDNYAQKYAGVAIPLNRLVIEAVCAALHAHTDAAEVLLQIDQLGEEDPELSARDAALLAITKYVNTRLASQAISMDEEAYQAATAQ